MVGKIESIKAGKAEMIVYAITRWRTTIPKHYY